MKVGVQLPEVERPVRWPELREMALTAETTQPLAPTSSAVRGGD